jgi:hypothetical protein
VSSIFLCLLILHIYLFADMSSVAKTVMEDLENACECSMYTCGCCIHLEERELHLNSTSKIFRVKEQLFRFSESLYAVLLHLYKNSCTCL